MPSPSAAWPNIRKQRGGSGAPRGVATGKDQEQTLQVNDRSGSNVKLQDGSVRSPYMLAACGRALLPLPRLPRGPHRLRPCGAAAGMAAASAASGGSLRVLAIGDR